MKYRKSHDARIIFRDVFDGIKDASSYIDDKSIWIGVFDESLCHDRSIRTCNIKRACVNDWKNTFRSNIDEWGCL